MCNFTHAFLQTVSSELPTIFQGESVLGNMSGGMNMLKEIVLRWVFEVLRGAKTVITNSEY